MTHGALERLVKTRVLGRSPQGAFLRVNERLWGHLPGSATRLRPVRAYGHLVHALARLQGNRTQAHGTYFLRNRPELDLIGRLANLAGEGRTVKLAVLGRRDRPDFGPGRKPSARQAVGQGRNLVGRG